MVRKPGVPRREKCCSFGRVTTFPGVGTAFYWDKGAEALIRGLVERVLFVGLDGGFYHPEPPADDAFRSLAPYRRMLKVRCARVIRGSRSDYVSTFTDHRRAAYERASASLEIEPLNERDFSATIFAKTEKTEKAPRVIIYRGHRFNIELGRYLKLAEHKIYQGINRVFGFRVVMKGRTLVQRAQAIRRSADAVGPDWVALMLDLSKCDAHTSRDAMAFEHSVYLSLFGNDPELRKLLQVQLNLRAKTVGGDTFVSVRKPGHRCSGDVNTSLGNVVVVTALMWHFCKLAGIRYRLINDGDDSVLFLPRSEVARVRVEIVKHFLRFGFAMRIDGETSLIERVEFCQSRPVFVGPYWTMTRSPVKVLGNDLVSSRIINIASALSHMKAIGGCGLSLYSGVPVLQAFYMRCNSLGKESRVLSAPDMRRIGVVRDARGVSPGCARPICASARVSFWKAWGIPVASQLSIEAAILSSLRPTQITDYRSLLQFPSLLSTPISFLLKFDHGAQESNVA